MPRYTATLQNSIRPHSSTRTDLVILSCWKWMREIHVRFLPLSQSECGQSVYLSDRFRFCGVGKTSWDTEAAKLWMSVFFKVNVMQECEAKNSLRSLTWKHVRDLKITSTGKVNSQSNWHWSETLHIWWFHSSMACLWCAVCLIMIHAYPSTMCY